ncbi:MAG: DUF4870 domain-containing protein [Planctomycetota bacterium]
MADPHSPEPEPAATYESGASKDERMWAMFCHLAALASHVFPFGNILGPMVVWLIKREEYPMVADQGKESMNFQITMTIAELICVVTCIGIPLALAVHIYAMVMAIIAGVKANEGQLYRYTYTWRLIT